MQNVVNFPDRARGFLPSRLIEARLALQKSRAELAREVGVTGQAIGYYEAGERRPDMALLLKIADALEQPAGFFLRGASVAPKLVGARFFRSVGPKSNKVNQALSVRTTWLFELVSFLSRYVRLPPVNLLREVAPPGGSGYSLGEIEHIATLARRHWSLGDGPIANVVALLETHGVIVTRFEIGEGKIDAFSAWIDGRPYIFLGSDKGSCVRSRFDAAHELGHLILHADISQEDLERKSVRDRIEQEANWFAGAFMMPRTSLLSEFYSTRLAHFTGLKRRWRMSMQAIAHRCKDVGAMDEHQFILFRKQMAARKWLTDEPIDNELPPEQPTWLARAWKSLIRNGRIVPTSAEDEIGFSVALVARLIGHDPNELWSDGSPAGASIVLK